MKKLVSLLLSLLLLTCSLCTVSCDHMGGLVGDVLESVDEWTSSNVKNESTDSVVYKETTIDKVQTTYGPLALINDTHEYSFPTEATKNLANIWEYRTAHTREGNPVPYKTSNTSLVMDGAALTAAHRWLTDFYKETSLGNATITSAYRAFEDQQSFQVAAGKSDHHSGYGITLKIVIDKTTYELDSDAGYNRLTENAYKYGFVVRYPEGKESITGLSDYTNYFHYVGYGPAAYMKANNLCLEEFVAEIKSYSVDKPLQVTDANGQDWLIYYTACSGEMGTIKVPSNFAYTMSGDNEGGIIVCVSLSKTAAEQQQESESLSTAQ